MVFPQTMLIAPIWNVRRFTLSYTNRKLIHIQAVICLPKRRSELREPRFEMIKDKCILSPKFTDD